MTDNENTKPRDWWILFRQWETIVMETKEDILKADPNPVNPKVNLRHVIEYSAYEKLLAENSFLKKLVEQSNWRTEQAVAELEAKIKELEGDV